MPTFRGVCVCVCVYVCVCVCVCVCVVFWRALVRVYFEQRSLHTTSAAQAT